MQTGGRSRNMNRRGVQVGTQGWQPVSGTECCRRENHQELHPVDIDRRIVDRFAMDQNGAVRAAASEQHVAGLGNRAGPSTPARPEWLSGLVSLTRGSLGAAR